MSLLVISEYIKDNLNAGPKAKVDVERIIANELKGHVKTFYSSKKISSSYFLKARRILEKWFFCNSIKAKYDWVLIQSPFTTKTGIIKNIKHKVILIHDIDGLRTQNAQVLKKELKIYDMCDAVIVHNDKMKEFLIQNGILKNKIYVLEIFDYLCKVEEKSKEFKVEGNLNVIYTGNLDKAPFLKQLDEDNMNFTMNIYGVGMNDFSNKNIKYKGKFSPDEVPNKIEGDLGLIWDGDIKEEDILKKYTKYNNPHKLSCYLAAGIPVIAWRKSAIASFIEKNNLGYVIDEIYDINKIDKSDYKEKQENAQKIGKLIREGYFTKKIIKNILNSKECDER